MWLTCKFMLSPVSMVLPAIICQCQTVHDGKVLNLRELAGSGEEHLDADQACKSSVSAFRVHAESHFGVLSAACTYPAATL